MRERFVKKFAPERLCVEITTYENLALYDNYKIEWKLLMEYFNKFGEFPPMNGLKPDKRQLTSTTEPN